MNKLIAGLVFVATWAFAAKPAGAQGVKPRFLIIVDTSGSMSLTPGGTETRGDGSARHPGCDVEGAADWMDSRLAQAKAALNDTISAFGSAEFALARYKSTDLSIPCTTDAQCPTDTAPGGGPRIWTCDDPVHVPGTQKYCAIRYRYGCNNNGVCYSECVGNNCCSGRKPGEPTPDPYDLYSKGLECPSAINGAGNKSDCTYPDCLGADVVVPFPSASSSNYSSLLSWLDGAEDYPLGTNKELRANGSTPVAGSLGAALNWLTQTNSTVGMGAGAKTTDAQAVCRQYSVILLTDGDENCDIRSNSRSAGGVAAATALAAAGIKTYVIGFAVDGTALTNLSAIAAAGGTGNAIAANNRNELTARLGDIIAGSIPTPKCDCDETCDGSEALSFPGKGSQCSVGKGRCKRYGQLACNAGQNGLICSSTPAGTCPGTALTAGPGLTEQCGQAAACDPSWGLTAEECADDDCDGEVDEGLSCQCAAKPEICNGVDDNCNNQIDEVAPVPCGLNIGECKPGTTACVNAQTQCQNATGPTPEICDGKDNDCDGITDGFGETCYPAGASGCTLVNGAYTCVGACQPGTRVCRDAAFGVCSGAITPSTELACDGIDNDCDGETDEGFNLGQPCGAGQSGVGECRAGKLECEGGAVVCKGGQGPVAEVCDGKDNDCDGNVDFPLGTCGPTLGECKPGQYRCENNQLVCDQPFGPKAEVCDGKDNDCDGAIDDDPIDGDLGSACSANVGICKAGVLRCISGRKVCDGGVLPSVEVCNNADDDCDGCVDCDPTCLANLGKTCNIPGSGQACGLSVGVCSPGMLLCVAGSIQCVGGMGPGTESCDGKDNDCNGFTDETDPDLGGRCYPDGVLGCNVAANTCVGECRFGAKLCVNAGFACSNPVTPANEVCDTKDNDCDGMTDDGFDVGAACDNGGTGLCRRTGTKICNARGDGTTCSVPPVQITQEICDGVDNDCDDQIDELPLPGVGVLCGSNVGECRAGTTKCVNGKLVCDEAGPMPEVCNGKDDDCDGSIDEGLVAPAEECPPAGLPAGAPIAGECKPGKYVCAKDGNGVWGWQCRGGQGPTEEICDGKDNDCDGKGDEMVMCPGTSMCVAGECAPQCSGGEFPCPADRKCQDGICVKNPCVNKVCPAGQYCDDAGACRDRCENANCAVGARCVNGVCLDCFTEGCPQGQLCRNRVCEPDPCSGISCGANAFCRAGQCVRTCTNVTCPSGQSCADGACVADLCAGKLCGANQFCDPADGQCKQRPCATISCVGGFRCIETLGRCETDPCIGVTCATADRCEVAANGRAYCAADPDKPQRREIGRVATSGGGLTNCSCRIGGADDASEAPAGGGWLALLVGAALSTRVLRRRRREDGRRTSGGGR